MNSGRQQGAPALVRIGFVRRAVGLKGEVEVEPLTDVPDRFARGLTVSVDGVERVVESVRQSRGGVAIKLTGIDDTVAAAGLRGRYVQVPLAQAQPLSEGHYYHWQLVGLAVTDAAGRRLGHVHDVVAYPANDVYVVRGETGETLIPALESVVKRIDLDAGSMVVELPAEEEVR